MRTSSVMTISLPPAMVKASDKVAEKQNMTRSELIRTALRNYIEQTQYHAKTMRAIAEYEKEKKQGALKKLDGSLADFLE